MKQQILNFKIEKQPHLRKIVYERLKDAILTGAIPKGTKLYESRIAEETGISRTPVREALHALERELLIAAIDKVGYRIVDTDVEDLEEISVIRKTVETLALKKAIDRIGAREISSLEDNLKRAEKTLRDHKGDLFIQFDAEFHQILCALSHSERLIRMADTLRKEMQRFRSRTKLDHDLATASLKYHQEIVSFLKMKDYRSAKKALSDHIDHAKRETQKEFMGGLRAR
ncbi:MAG TPA: GntR family transcriptional regulator [Syntrophorhabdales bacterium]|nr:GntR family transcriptional regulator [Syntrophorhabdales bacterium]